MRTQCLNLCISLLSHTWILDDRECTRLLTPINSCLTEFLLADTVPGGFLNELLNRTALKPEVFDIVI